MLKRAITLTAGCCLAIGAATGLGAGMAKVFTLKVGDVAAFPSDVHCQALTACEIACGAKVAASSIQVYYAPHQLEVIKPGATLTKGKLLLNIKRRVFGGRQGRARSRALAG